MCISRELGWKWRSWVSEQHSHEKLLVQVATLLLFFFWNILSTSLLLLKSSNLQSLRHVYLLTLCFLKVGRYISIRIPAGSHSIFGCDISNLLLIYGFVFLMTCLLEKFLRIIPHGGSGWLYIPVGSFIMFFSVMEFCKLLRFKLNNFFFPGKDIS